MWRCQVVPTPSDAERLCYITQAVRVAPPMSPRRPLWLPLHSIRKEDAGPMCNGQARAATAPLRYALALPGAAAPAPAVDQGARPLVDGHAQPDADHAEACSEGQAKRRTQ